MLEYLEAMTLDKKNVEFWFSELVSNLHNLEM
jgi:hypothetical protein